MGHYDGWENFVPNAAPRKQSRGERMHARATVVTADGTLFSAAEAKANGIVGIFFHSKKEASAWLVLKDRERRGEIVGLQRQVPFVLHARSLTGEFLPVGKYLADFVWHTAARPGLLLEMHVADVKGQARREDLYKWKKKHLQIEYGAMIEEI
jgi:hypothetical protein